MTQTITAATPTTDAPRAPGASRRGRVEGAPYVLDPADLVDHIDVLFRVAWALCGSRDDAEDLVQTTFAHVLKRPRIIRANNERGYLLRALRNAYASRYRARASAPTIVPLQEDHTRAAADPAPSASELMNAVATAPSPYKEAVIAVDILGLSYGEAARSLHTREKTIATRLHRGRQHVARELTDRGLRSESA